MSQDSSLSGDRSRRWRRLGAWAGVAGPTVFVATFMIEGWLRPGYEPTRMFVSALSMGPRGWIQILNFLIVGASLLLFARGIAAQFPDGKASRAGPILLTAIGLGLFFSGPFVMDPPAIPFPQMTPHSKVHNLLGAVVFSLGPAVCLVFYRRFRSDLEWKAFRAWSLTAGLVMITAVVLMKIAMLPKPASPNVLTDWLGVIQRVAIISLMSWVATVGWAMLGRSREELERGVSGGPS